MKQVLIAALLFSNTAFTQSVSNNDTSFNRNKETSYTTASVMYSSNIVFAGRKDSTPVPYISPSIAYYHKSGLFASGSFSYLTAAGESRIDLYTLAAGYVYKKKNVIASISATKYFFSDKSFNVQSQINGFVSAYAGYDFNNILTVYADASFLFSSETDLLFGTEMNHSFYALNNALKITPTAYAGFGTQNYYSEYYTYRNFGSGSYGRGGYGNGSSGQTEIISSVESKKLKLLNYEFSLPVSFSIGNVDFFATPVFVVPLSPSTITVNGITTKEPLSNTFYWMAGLEYSF